MKTTLFLLCLFCATVALGQSYAPAALSSEIQPLQMNSHPLRAVPHAMAAEQNLLDGSTYVYAQGERPLWEVAAPVKVAIPLGDVARMFREDHLTAKKADFVRKD